MICSKCRTPAPNADVTECLQCGGEVVPSAEDLLRYPKYGIVQEVRPPQIQMTSLIEEALHSNNHEELILEGGCGVGKTFAYLTPALPRDGRVVISTGNKMLQDQLNDKDIPFLMRVLKLGNKKSFVNLKGKSNYICKKRLKSTRLKKKFAKAKKTDVWERINVWADEDPLGDIKSFQGIESFDTFPLFLTRVDDCDKKSCKYHEECGFFQLRQKAKEADVVLVNHYLLGWDLRLGKGLLLDHYDTLIIDEAHGAPDAIRSAFTTVISQAWLKRFLEEVKGEEVELHNVDPDGVQADWDAMFFQMKHETGPRASRVLEVGFFGHMLYRMVDHMWSLYDDIARYVRVRWSPSSEIDFNLSRTELLAEYEELFQQIEHSLWSASRRDPMRKEDLKSFRAVVGLLERLHDKTKELIGTTEEDENIVYSFEKKDDKFIVKGEPINLAPLVQQEFHTKFKVLLTSATLHEQYLKSELGLKPTHVKKWPAPFNYAKNALLYLPRHIPLPSTQEDGWRHVIQCWSQEIQQLVEMSEGRALVLFSAKKDLEGVWDYFEDNYDIEYPIFAQRDGEPASSVTEKFLKHTSDHPIIFGMRSFFEGFDIKGQAIQLVIIPKIPFQDFNDPLNVGKKRILGNKHWTDYYYPNMENAIRQAAGRLIRSHTDRGVIAILDARMWVGGLTKRGVEPKMIADGDMKTTLHQWKASNKGWPGNYGYKIFESLPFSNCTWDIEDVEAFFVSLRR